MYLGYRNNKIIKEPINRIIVGDTFKINNTAGLGEFSILETNQENTVLCITTVCRTRLGILYNTVKVSTQNLLNVINGKERLSWQPNL